MDHQVQKADLSKYSNERLQKELAGIQMAIEMLLTKNNSLEDLDLTEGGGSPQDQAEYRRLKHEADLLVAEVNKRHLLELVG